MSGKVSLWADQSGNGNDVSQSNAALRPTYVASSINSLPGFTFDSANIVLNNTATVLASGSARTVFAVCKPTQVFGLAGSLCDFESAGPHFWCILGIVGTAFVFSDGTTNFVDTAPPSINGVPLLGEWTGQAGVTNLALNINAAAQTLNHTSFASDTGTKGFQVGNDESGGFQFRGDISEILVWDHILTGGEVTKGRKYIQTKYNISLGV